jgi:uncharacterized FAD-dependent dehydrogenase
MAVGHDVSAEHDISEEHDMSEIQNEERLRRKIAKKLKLKPGTDFSYELIRRSADARMKPELFYNYVVDVRVAFALQDDKKQEACEKKQEDFEKKLVSKLNDPAVVFHQPQAYQFPYFAASGPENDSPERPVIIGTGPAGLFCGYMLAMAGFRPILLERGEAVEERALTVEAFWQNGVLNAESNVQFGEGGAGTFSDGKLSTQVKDRDGIKKAVLSVFVDAGAPPEIIYEQKPHLGTDMLKKIVVKIRQKIIRYGGEVRFGQKVTGFLLDAQEQFPLDEIQKEARITGVIINDDRKLLSNHVVLAIGHSARDTFSILHDSGVKMEAKPFAVGLRVEHPQILINHAQYGVDCHALLGAADYKLVGKKSEQKAFSFCMCPGGYIVNASSEEGRLAINGMSYRAREGDRANSAIVMTVNPDELESEHPLKGVEYQRRLEEKAHEIGKGKIPVEYLGVFREAVAGGSEKESESRGHRDKNDSLSRAAEGVVPAAKGAYRFAAVHEILDQKQNQAFLAAMCEFGRQIPGFDDDFTVIAGVESRTSSPVRILRDEHFQANFRGLYPCGEGAGYAGGIMSAAIDGVRVAAAVAGQKEDAGKK